VVERYRQTGGARLDGVNASWRFAKLSVSEQALGISVFGREYVFPREAITRLSEHRGFVSTGLRIEHRAARAPGLVVFWASVGRARFARLATELERRGYAVVR
jgi:hypothetical protein